MTIDLPPIHLPLSLGEFIWFQAGWWGALLFEAIRRAWKESQQA